MCLHSHLHKYTYKHVSGCVLRKPPTGFHLQPPSDIVSDILKP